MKKLHICSNCFDEFESKDIFVATKNQYSTIYCADCLKSLGIENFFPYLKSKKKKEGS